MCLHTKTQGFIVRNEITESVIGSMVGKNSLKMICIGLIFIGQKFITPPIKIESPLRCDSIRP